MRFYYMTRKSTSDIIKLVRANLRHARRCWPLAMSSANKEILKSVTRQFRFSISYGDLVLLDRGWYVTHTGLIRLARNNRCAGIHVRPVPEFSDPSAQRWAFEATVYKSRACRGFVGFGDADPSNISSLVQGAEMRVAETRAVNRACARLMELASAHLKRSVLLHSNRKLSGRPNRLTQISQYLSCPRRYRHRYLDGWREKDT